MAGRYDHLFLTNPYKNLEEMEFEGVAASPERPPNLGEPRALMAAAAVPGSTAYVTTSWIHECNERSLWVHEHSHDFDEILVFLGGDPENEEDLGAEVFMTIEGEEHLVTTTSSVFIPSGVKHCPLGFNSVTRPFRFLAILFDGTYTGRAA